MNNQQKLQVLEQIKSANNVLVAVSSNPSVDELAASVGLTLILNKLDKHATTVFSGIVPSTIEFLQPEKTIETTTDSLRDFIIALDKSKADKLRYKVEDDVVRIFITPYRTSISEKDLQFSQGDFNVDLVLALGVTNREDLDKAITAHGRILHDAAVISLTAQSNVSELGTLNWQEAQASSLCEMVAALLAELPPNTADGQTATSLLTGIIAETDRFRNQRTTPYTLTLSAQLMASGANQQLIADKLEEPEPLPEPTHIAQQRSNPEQELAEIAESVRNGELEIDHETEREEEVNKIHIDEHGNLGDAPEETSPSPVPATLPPPEQPVDEPRQKRLPDEQLTDELKNEPDTDSAREQTTQASLAQPPSTTPVMSHEKVIMPPSREDGTLRTDKPFDLQEAMKAAESPDGASSQPLTPKTAKPGSPIEPLTIPPQPVPRPPSQNFSAASPQSPAQQSPPQQYQSQATDQPVTNTSYVSTPVPPVTPPSQQTPVQPPVSQPVTPVPPWTPPPEPPEPPKPVSDTTSDKSHKQTLRELEEAVGSKHVKNEVPPKKEAATLSELEDAVAKAADSQETAFPPHAESVGASNVDLGSKDKDDVEPQSIATPTVNDPTAPPPVPPPMTPQFFDGDGNNNNPFLNPKP